MKKINTNYATAILHALLLVCVLGSTGFSQDLPAQIDLIKKQLIKKDDIIAGRFPEYTINGKWHYSEGLNWFAGFTGGELWYLFELTGEQELKKRALAHADKLTAHADSDFTHDVGFIFQPSCIKAYQITGEKKYREAAIKAAEMLTRRFNSKGEFIRAWGKLSSPAQAGVMIIDSMMNIELLFWAAEETGDKKFYDIAYKHATTVMNQNVRSDGSSYHLIEFDPATGKVLDKRTKQAYRKESTWGRGQAWGIYGFANAYRRTGDEKFLYTSKELANFYISRLQDDHLSNWDLNLSGPGIKRDASAAAIAASGLFLLSEQVKTDDLKEKYQSYAEKITKSLLKKCLYTTSTREIEEGILIHQVLQHNRGKGVDESNPAGDYYFVEAVKKLHDRLK